VGSLPLWKNFDLNLICSPFGPVTPTNGEPGELWLLLLLPLSLLPLLLWVLLLVLFLLRFAMCLPHKWLLCL
jgi:hypothetical protein